MKKYLIAFLAMLVILAVSFIYKGSIVSNVFMDFPQVKGNDEGETFYLFLFFSKHSCKSCLEIIDVLERLPKPFKIYGIVPGDELENKAELIDITGFPFDLLGSEDFYKYQPGYYPSIMGVWQDRIYFLLPVTPELKDTFYNLAMSYYYTLTRVGGVNSF